MDILEDFEKPIMTELLKKCPDIDGFEKLKSLSVSTTHKIKDDIKDVWVGNIYMSHAGRRRLQPIVWLKFQEDKLDIGVVDTPTETYEYADPHNGFSMDRIVEIVNKITKTYRAHRR